MLRHDAPGVGLDAPEVRLATQSTGAVEGRAQGLLLIDADREPLAPLAPAVREDLLPTAGRHSGSEAVRSDATEVVGLIGALHGNVLVRGRRRKALNRPIVKRARPSARASTLGGASRAERCTVVSRFAAELLTSLQFPQYYDHFEASEETNEWHVHGLGRRARAPSATSGRQ